MDKQTRKRPSPRSRPAASASASAAYVAPNLSGRLFGLDPDGNPQASLPRPPVRRPRRGARRGRPAQPKKQKRHWLAAGMACDVADVGAGALAGIRGTLPPASAAMVTATAAFFALTSAYLLQQ